MATPHFVGENETVAVHITGQRALGYRVEVTYRSTAKLMRQQPLPAWVRTLETIEFPEYAKAVSVAKRVLKADIS